MSAVILLIVGMIKVEDAIDDAPSKVCFNPECSMAIHRVFDGDHPHAYHIPCIHWIIDFREFDWLRLEDRENVMFNFGGTPLSENLNSCRLLNAMDIEGYLTKVRQHLLAGLNNAVDGLSQEIRKKYLQVPAQQIIQKISSLNGCLGDPSTLDKIESIVCCLLEPLANVKLLLKLPLLSDFNSEIGFIEKLGRKFYQEQFEEPGTNFGVITEEQAQKIRHFVLQSEAPYNKLQEIASLCSAKADLITVRGASASLKCPLCPTILQVEASLQESLKKTKKLLASEVLQHCFVEHTSTLVRTILPRVDPVASKKDPNRAEFTYGDLISEVGSWQKLRIIDRESGIPFKANPADELCVQVLSRANQSMSRCRHILTEERRATEFLIYFLIIDVTTARKLVSWSNVKLESKSLSLEKLQRIAQLFKGFDFFETNRNDSFKKKVLKPTKMQMQPANAQQPSNVKLETVIMKKE